MTFILKLAVRLLPLILLFVAATSLLSLRSCAESVGAGSSGGDNNGETPTTANCAQAGVLDPDNPFTTWPAAGGVNWGRVTATFCDPIYLTNFGNVHHGFDLGYPAGHDLLASADGQIARAGNHSSMGNYIEICHVSGYCAIYMHMTDVHVSAGDIVIAGDIVGTVGSTGNSTGPHLHFEVRNPARQPIDPAPSL